MALLATCFLHFGGKPSGNGNDGATSHMFPTCFPHFGGKPRTGNGNEGAPDALLTGKGTEGVLLPAYPTIWTGNRKWWRFWPEFLTAQGILLSWLSVCKLSADYLSREPVGIWPIPNYYLSIPTNYTVIIARGSLSIVKPCILPHFI